MSINNFLTNGHCKEETVQLTTRFSIFHCITFISVLPIRYACIIYLYGYHFIYLYS